MIKWLMVVISLVSFCCYAAIDLTKCASEEIGGVRWRYVVQNGKSRIARVDIPSSTEQVAAHVAIPTELGGFPVDAILNKAFCFSTNLVSVVIPEQVSKIEAGAFLACHRLKSIESASGEFNFELNRFNQGVFDGCTSLETVELSRRQRIIPIGTFMYCKALKEFHVGENVTNIDHNAFYGCSSLRKVNVPGKVESIGAFTFAKCPSLKSIALPESLKELGNGAFKGCSALESIVIPSSVKEIGEQLFRDCSSINSVTFDANCLVGDIPAETFWECRSLKKVNIPRAVTNIVSSAFYGCTGLMMSGDGIPKLTVDEGNEHYSMQEGMLITKDGRRLLYLFKDVAKFRVPEKVETVDRYAFVNCTNLVELTISPACTSIVSAVRRCSSLTNMVVDAGNECFIGKGAKLFTRDGEQLLAFCRGADEGAIEEGVAIIADGAGSNCGKIRELRIPDSVTSIGDNAFSSCLALKNVRFGANLRKLGSHAFAWDVGLEKIELPGSLAEMGRNAFIRCTSLKTVVFNGNAPQVAEYATPFDETPDDLLIVVPDGSTGWGEDAEGKLPPTWQGKKIVRKSEYEKMATVSTEK